jgi:hypothetical protein
MIALHRAIRILRHVNETLVLVLQALFPHPDALRPRPAADAPAERHAHLAPVLEYSRPDSDGPGAEPDGARSRRSWYVTPIGGMVRRGRWSVERRLVFIAVIGGMNLDLREAQLTAPEVVVTAVSVIGGVNLIVPPGIRVEVDHFGLVGGRNIDTDEIPEPDAPTVRLRAFAIIGGVKVRRTRLMDT